jgi:hypothetical protein
VVVQGAAGEYGSSEYGALPYGASTAASGPIVTGAAADAALDAPTAGVATAASPVVDAWTFDGEPLPRFVNSVREWQRLTLTFDVTPSQYTLALEPLESGAGNVRVLDAADGSYRATDTAGGAATVTVEPPTGQAGVRRSGEYRVEELRREQSDHRGTGRVTLVLVPVEPKPLPSAPVQESRASDEWGIRFQTGTVATHLVEAEVLNEETPGATGGGYELSLLLTPAQTRTVEGHVSRLGAVSGVSPPGATGVTTDDSVDDRLTVRVTSPSGGKPPSGGWIITDWSTEYLTDEIYRVTLRVEGAGGDANVPGATQPSDPDATIESPWVVTGEETVTGTTTVTGTPPSGVTVYASPLNIDDETFEIDDETVVVEDQ